MTHEFTGTLPALNQHTWVEKPTKNALKKACLTHDLTHQMTHAFGSQLSHEMSVITGVATKFPSSISAHFFPVFLTAKKLCQIPARIMTQLLFAACSLSYSFTFKTVIL